MLIKQNTKKRNVSSNDISDLFNPDTIRKPTSGTAVFVLDVEQFEKY